MACEFTLVQDKERIFRLRDAMKDEGFDAIAVSSPENVLLVTGYYPVVGTSIALATRDGEILLFVPEDEMDLARESGASTLIPFHPASLDRITNAVEVIRKPLMNALIDKRLSRKVVGYEDGSGYEAASYASMHFYGSSIAALLDESDARPASEMLRRMKRALTPIETERVRRSCRVAGRAYAEGRSALAPELKETEAALAFRGPLFAGGVGFEGAARAEGYVFCMAGKNSARAYGAYARSRDNRIQEGDFVLTHCNSHTDGYWTDVTRTYSIGDPDDRKIKIYNAVFKARLAALECVRPGVKAREVDRAARDVMRSYGFGDNFKHPAGHGVGFYAINHDALPRIHPKSDETIETGMVFNVEPAAYFEGYGGVRHCDMVVVMPSGAELLTPFQCEIESVALKQVHV